MVSQPCSVDTMKEHIYRDIVDLQTHRYCFRSSLLLLDIGPNKQKVERSLIDTDRINAWSSLALGVHEPLGGAFEKQS